MIKLVVFDWNGTLIADTRACMEADNHVLKVFGGKQVNLKTYRATIIIPSNIFYIQHGCNGTQLALESKKLGEIFHSYYEPQVLKVRTRKNAHKLLSWLYKNKIKSIILSNHTVKGIENQLERLNLGDLFSEVIANDALDSSMKERNKEAKLETYLHKNNLHPNEVIIAGDSPEEIEIGKHLGVTTVATTNGYYATSRLAKSRPDYLIGNLGEIINIIKKLR